MEDFAPERALPGDPERCQAVGANGEQCIFKGMHDPSIVPGAGGMSQRDVRRLKFCKMHGSATAKSAKKEAKRVYQVLRYKDKLDRLSDPEVGVNLDEELAVLRMTLEECLQKYEQAELVTMSGQVSSLVRDIRDTLTANKKLKSQMGELLERAAMMKLCDKMVAIMTKHLPAEKMDEVSIEVGAAIAQIVTEGNGQ